MQGFALLLTSLLCTLTVVGCQRSDINAETTLQCHVRTYTYNVSQPFRTKAGRVIPCWDNVKVMSCWGRCLSDEIADWRVPYKISNHPVCMYRRRKRRIVVLRHCHKKHPHRLAKVFDAVDCECMECNPSYTSCESLHG